MVGLQLPFITGPRRRKAPSTSLHYWLVAFVVPLQLPFITGWGLTGQPSTSLHYWLGCSASAFNFPSLLARGAEKPLQLPFITGMDRFHLLQLPFITGGAGRVSPSTSLHYWLGSDGSAFNFPSLLA